MGIEIDGGTIVYQLRDGIPYYLLLKSATSGFWGFCKGHLEAQESVIEAAKRELQEETGIIADIQTDFFDVVDYQVGPNTKKVTFFSAEVPTNTVLRLQSEEISTAGWFDYITAYQKLSYLNLKQALNHFDEYQKKARTK